jgi:hypothetical protein
MPLYNIDEDDLHKDDFKMSTREPHKEKKNKTHNKDKYFLTLLDHHLQTH